LQVKATNSDGIWNQAPESMTILVIPPWWLTPWFKVVAVAAGLLLLSLPFFYRISLLKKQRRQQEEVIQVISSTQEKERQRISRDLHDSVGGQLAGIKHKLSEFTQRVPELQPTLDLLDNTYDEVRRISHNITPGTLMKLGLPAGIQSLAETVHSDKTRIQTYFFGIDRLNNKDYETNVFRIVQELLQNALKHGKASEIEIQLTRRDQLLSVMVSDNGQGFDTTGIAQKAGNGLKNIAHRVRQLKGQFHIDSTLGKGTSITVEIPIIPGL
jgi:signal transduction histidine kinase